LSNPENNDEELLMTMAEKIKVRFELHIALEPEES
jgi:hypothetical protein